MRLLTILASLLLLSLTGCGQVFGPNVTIGGNVGINNVATAVPVVSSLVSSSDESTIVAQWTTNVPGTSQLDCGTDGSTYPIHAVDNGVATGVYVHSSGVGGLALSTAYSCIVHSQGTLGTASQTFTISTTAALPYTPATGVSFDQIRTYNSINSANQGAADTYYSAVSNDGYEYITNDDTQGFTENGQPTGVNAPLSLMRLTSSTAPAAVTIQSFSNYGPCCVGTGDDNRSEKNSGLLAMNGQLFMTVGRQQNAGSGLGASIAAYPQSAAQVIVSNDHGATWNNFQQPNTFVAGGNVTSPPSASMFGTTPTDMGTATFVMYCKDNGTYGYTDPCKRHDGGNLWTYLAANEGVWNGGGTGGGGNAVYLARVPSAKLAHLIASDYQWFTGGDGRLDSNWSASQTSAVAYISNPGAIGEFNFQYVPALNSYLLLTFSYRNGAPPSTPSTTQDALWTTYNCQHPWGPCNVINVTEWPTQGYYNPIIQASTIQTGLTPTIWFTSDFGPGASVPGYQATLARMTITH